MGEPGGLALIPRQSSLSCETKFLAHLWKDLVFTAAGTSVDLGDPLLREATCARIASESYLSAPRLLHRPAPGAFSLLPL